MSTRQNARLPAAVAQKTELARLQRNFASPGGGRSPAKRAAGERCSPARVGPAGRARHGNQLDGSPAGCSDIVGGRQRVHFEVRRHEPAAILDWLAAAVLAAGDGSVSVVVYSQPRSGWGAVMPLGDLLQPLWGGASE